MVNCESTTARPSFPVSTRYLTLITHETLIRIPQKSGTTDSRVPIIHIGSKYF